MFKNHNIVRPWDGVDPTGPQYRIQEVQRLLGVSRGSIYNMIANGQLPPLLKIGKRVSAMPKAWLDSCLISASREALAKPNTRRGHAVGDTKP